MCRYHRRRKEEEEEEEEEEEKRVVCVCVCVCVIFSVWAHTQNFRNITTPPKKKLKSARVKFFFSFLMTSKNVFKPEFVSELK